MFIRLVSKRVAIFQRQFQLRQVSTKLNTNHELSEPDLPRDGIYYHEKLVLGYSRAQMCDLVYNVSQYREFVPFCTHSEIIEELNKKPALNLKQALKSKQFKSSKTLISSSSSKLSNDSKNKGGGEIQKKKEMKARLQIGYPPIKESYVSHVTMIRPESVRAQSRDTNLFAHLINEWRFVPYVDPANSAVDTDGCCILEFYVSFKFHSAFYSELSSMFMDQIFKKMVSAFLSRARYLHGPPIMPPTSLYKTSKR